MSIERRRFLKSAALGAVSAGLALSMGRAALGQKRKPLDARLGFPIPIKAQEDVLFYFSEATFRPYVNGYFQAPNARGEMVSLKLVSVTGHRARTTATLMRVKAPETQAFSLLFKASERLPPFTSIHNVQHPSLGEFNLFLTPREKDGEFFYEAVFNHI